MNNKIELPDAERQPDWCIINYIRDDDTIRFELQSLYGFNALYERKIKLW